MQPESVPRPRGYAPIAGPVEPEAEDTSRLRKLGHHSTMDAAHRVLSFVVSVDMPVGGDIVRAGELLMWDEGCHLMKPWSILVFSNGFYAIARSSGLVQSFAWSPFCILHEELSNPNFSGSVFTLSMVVQDMGFLFATQQKQPEEDMEEMPLSSWVTAMARALRTYTSSMFPSFSMAVEPLPHVPSTVTRILASYLLCHGSACVGACALSNISVPYCELQAHRHGQAFLVMYASDTCEIQVESHTITQDTEILHYEGVDCSCFSVGSLWLCAPGIREKRLWLLALGKVKVELMRGTPDPASEDLRRLRRTNHHEHLELWGRRSAESICSEREPISWPQAPQEREPISSASPQSAGSRESTEELPLGIAQGEHPLQDVVHNAWALGLRCSPELEEDSLSQTSSLEDEPWLSSDIGCEEGGMLPRTSAPGPGLHVLPSASPREGPTGPSDLAPQASAAHADDTNCAELLEVPRSGGAPIPINESASDSLTYEI